MRDGKKIPSKRETLSVIMSVFDPLGFIAPFTIQARILMQNVWRSGIQWDKKFIEKDFEFWKVWISELKNVENCKISRCYKPREDSIVSTELHLFCDASENAYAAVGYWRFKLKDGKFHTSIIMAKSKVAPLKPTTILRLELQAAILAVRMAKITSQQHTYKFERRVFWSDSRTVLQWLKSDPRTFKTYVMNRLGEICEETNVDEWRWVSTKDNPAERD